MYAPGQLGVALYLQDDASGAPLTRLYIDQNETLFDAGQVYRTARGSLVARAPLADVLLPKWNLGDYISQTQLATLLGVPIAEVEMQEFSQFALLPAALKRVEPAQAKKGYTYFQLQTDQPNAPTLTLGLPLGELFAESTPLHVLILHPAHNAALELDGSLSAATPILTPPTSRMKDDDIAVFAQVPLDLAGRDRCSSPKTENKKRPGLPAADAAAETGSFALTRSRIPFWRSRKRSAVFAPLPGQGPGLWYPPSAGRSYGRG